MYVRFYCNEVRCNRKKKNVQEKDNNFIMNKRPYIDRSFFYKAFYRKLRKV